MIQIDNKYMIVSNENWIISLIWKDATSLFNDTLFKESALQFHSIVENFKVKKSLLIWENLALPYLQK